MTALPLCGLCRGTGNAGACIPCGGTGYLERLRGKERPPRAAQQVRRRAMIQPRNPDAR